MKIPPEQFYNLGDKRKLAKTAAEVVRSNHDDESYSAILCLVACYIDGLSTGEREDYLQTLRDHFPALCSELGAEVFYRAYRNGIVHNFSPKRGYGIARGSDLGERRAVSLTVGEALQPIIAVNIDKLADDFIAFAKSVAAQSQEGES